MVFYYSESISPLLHARHCNMPQWSCTSARTFQRSSLKERKRGQLISHPSDCNWSKQAVNLPEQNYLVVLLKYNDNKRTGKASIMLKLQLKCRQQTPCVCSKTTAYSCLGTEQSFLLKMHILDVLKMWLKPQFFILTCSSSKHTVTLL